MPLTHAIAKFIKTLHKTVAKSGIASGNEDRLKRDDKNTSKRERRKDIQTRPIRGKIVKTTKSTNI